MMVLACDALLVVLPRLVELVGVTANSKVVDTIAGFSSDSVGIDPVEVPPKVGTVKVELVGSFESPAPKLNAVFFAFEAPNVNVGDKLTASTVQVICAASKVDKSGFGSEVARWPLSWLLDVFFSTPN